MSSDLVWSTLFTVGPQLIICHCCLTRRLDSLSRPISAAIDVFQNNSAHHVMPVCLSLL